jgi:DNA polymerase III delta subunit
LLSQTPNHYYFMLYVFSGSDTILTRKRAHDAIAKEASSGATVRTFLPETYEVGAVQSVLQSTSLFGGRECVVFDTVSDAAGALEEMVEGAEGLAGSPHTVVVIEVKLSADHAKVLKKYAEEWFESKAPESERFNPFSLADALAKRDKKTLWLLLMRARSAGLSPEEIIGTLFWQLKSLRLTRVTQSAAEADMKDFPYTKAKAAVKQFSPQDLERLSHTLVTLYHEGHLGTNIDLALEKWVLTI